MKRFRHTILLVLLGLLSVWPLAQFALVRTHGMDPAALGAWGDHATPNPRPRLVVHLVDDGRRERLRLSEMPHGVQEIGRDFLRQRSALGQLETPLQLAEAILAAYDQPAGVEIQVVTDLLERSTARVGQYEDSYSYARGEFD